MEDKELIKLSVKEYFGNGLTNKEFDRKDLLLRNFLDTELERINQK